MMLVTLAAGGHALLVGVPGLAKTLLVSSLAEALSSASARSVHPRSAARRHHRHRRAAGSRTAGAACASSRARSSTTWCSPTRSTARRRRPRRRCSSDAGARVTVGTHTHALPDPFQVFATRNPIEQEGTYPLPEAQLDRFLLEIIVEYPSEEQEREIARAHHVGRTSADPAGAAAERHLRASCGSCRASR